MTVYDDQNTNETVAPGQLADLEQNLPKSPNPDVATEASATSELDTQLEAPSATKPDAQKSEINDEGPSALNDIQDRLGLGYTGNPKEQPKNQRRLNKMYTGKSPTKKRLAIAAAFGGASFGAAVIAFLLMLPLKMETIINNVEGHYGAATQDALDKGTDKMVSTYFAKYVLPGLRNGTCGSTVSAKCVSNVPNDNSPIQKAFRAWKEQKIETKLADQGILMGKKKGGQYFLTIGDVTGNIRESDIEDVINFRRSLFDVDLGTTKVSRNEFRTKVREAVNGMSRRDKIYMRFKLGAFLERKYGLKRCWIACKLRDDAADTLDSKKNAARLATANMVQRIISPHNEEMSTIFGCVIASTECGVNAPGSEGDDVSSEGSTRDTRYRREMQSRLQSYATRYGEEALADLLARVDEIEQRGSLGKYIASKALAKVVGTEAADKLVGLSNPVSWIITGSKVVNFINNAGPTVKKLSYAINVSAVAIPMYMAYRTSVDEMHAGGTSGDSSYTYDATMVDSTLALLDNHGIDASQAPVWGDINQTPSGSKSIASSIIGGTAYAASTTSPYKEYRCSDGQPVPAGYRVCPEVMVGVGNKFLTGLSDAAKKIPGWSVLESVANVVTDNFIMDGFNWVMKGTSELITSIPGIGNAAEFVSKLISPLIASISTKLVANILIDGSNSDAPTNTSPSTASKPSLFAKAYAATASPETKDSALLPSGARMFEIIALGADASFNEDCQAQLGCKGVSDETAAAIRQQRIAEQRANFRSKNFFARMFDTSSPYSMTSRVALTMPYSFSGAKTNIGNNIASMGLNTLPVALSNIFHVPLAQAAPTADAFGVKQNAITDTDIQEMGDWTTFWKENCEGDKFETYTKSWLNDMTFDEDTGMSRATRINGCLYIQTISQSSAGFFDASLLPQETLHQDPGASGSPAGSIVIASFNILGSNHTGPYAKRADLSIDVIRNNNVGIVGLQELQNDQRSYILNKLPNYEIFPSRTTKDKNHRVENSIIWDTTKFKYIDGGYQPNLTYKCTSDKLDAPFVRLQMKSSEQEFYVMNTHDPLTTTDRGTNPCGTTTAAKQRYQNAKEHLAFIKEKLGDSLPIYYTGDFNSNYILKTSPTDNGYPYQGKAKNLTYCILTSSGYVNDAYDTYKNRAVTCPNTTPPGAGSGIDHVYTTKNITVTNYTTVAKGTDSGKSGSDHPAIIVTTQLPGSGSSNNTSSTPTSITLEGVKNFRDAAASTTGILKPGVLYRSSQLDKMTSADSTKLATTLTSNGTIIDLRTTKQRQKAEDVTVSSVANKSIPIDGILDQAPMVTDATRRKQLAKALKTAGSTDGPVLIHCVYGKDRTGWAIAMIMYIAGATDEQVSAEYLKSNEAYPGEVKQEWLDSGLSAARKKYNSINGYLKKGLGLTDAEIQQIRDKFGVPQSASN